MNISNYSKPVYLCRLDKDFSTEEEYAEYDRKRRSLNQSPNAKCYNANCDQYNKCRGICKKTKEYCSRLEQCPLKKWYS